MSSTGAFTLAWADLRGLTRSTFILSTVAVLTGIVVPIMAFALYGVKSMRDALMFLCVVAELLVGVFLAARIAATRRTRFVENIYTTPVEMRTWLTSQALVGLALAALLISIYLPYIAVYTAFVGPPHMLGPVLLAAGIVGICSVALGLFFGVIVGQAGPGAAAGLAAGFGFLSFFGLIVHGIAASPGAATGLDALLVRITSISPLALAWDATGLDMFGYAVTERWRPILGVTVFATALAAAAWFSYVKLQSPLGWEPRRGRLVAVGLVAIALGVPVATSATTFHSVETPQSFLLDFGNHTRVAFVAPGQPFTDKHFTVQSMTSWSSLTHGHDNQLDALVMITLPPDSVERVTIQVKGSQDIAVVGGGQRSISDGRPDGHARQQEGVEVSSQGPLRPVFRVPVTVRPLQADALLASPSIVEVHTRMLSDGSWLDSHDRLMLHATVPGASMAMLAAGTPVPLAALGAAISRRIRTR